jgi:hypothetical protein
MSTKTLESLDLAIAQKRVSDYSDELLRTPEDTDDWLPARRLKDCLLASWSAAAPRPIYRNFAT